jgi:hypothetical protein
MRCKSAYSSAVVPVAGTSAASGWPWRSCRQARRRSRLRTTRTGTVTSQGLAASRPWMRWRRREAIQNTSWTTSSTSWSSRPSRRAAILATYEACRRKRVSVDGPAWVLGRAYDAQVGLTHVHARSDSLLRLHAGHPPCPRLQCPRRGDSAHGMAAPEASKVSRARSGSWRTRRPSGTRKGIVVHLA